jgi:serine/threonine protein phosphatase 1
MPSQNSGRLIAVGDIHGCIHGLDALLAAVNPASDDQLVFLGDLVDQGANSREVIDRLIELRNRCRMVLIQGNHEEMLFAACDGLARGSVDALRFWERCGGIATVNSYKFGGAFSDILPEHWQLLSESRSFYETDEFIFTHASYVPELPMAEQPGRQLRWALFDESELAPHCSGKTVFVGHTEQRSGDPLDLGFAVCIDTAGWRYGWITALEVRTREIWQASRWGMLRETGQATPGDKLAKMLHPPGQ